MRVGDFQGARIYKLVPEEKRLKKDGSLRALKKLGKIHFPVFTHDGLRVVGFMVKQPDVAGMIKQPDRFVALDAVDVQDDQLVVADLKASYDAAAAARLGIDLDSCLIWTGMDVVTESGKRLGYCADATCHPRTGAVDSFMLTAGAASTALIGTIEMPASYLKRYAHGAMVVDDRAADLEFSGGAAAKAAEATVHARESAKKGAKVLDEKGAEAVDKGSRALGRRIGQTGDAIKGFSEEYKKAAGAPAKPAKKPAQSSGSAARAVGKQLGKTSGMFSGFVSEFKKASAPSTTKKKPSSSK